jgi:hypothetical protein
MKMASLPAFHSQNIDSKGEIFQTIDNKRVTDFPVLVAVADVL